MDTLIPVVNKLQDVFGAIGQQTIDLPQIVVVSVRTAREDPLKPLPAQPNDFMTLIRVIFSNDSPTYLYLGHFLSFAFLSGWLPERRQVVRPGEHRGPRFPPTWQRHCYSVPAPCVHYTYIHVHNPNMSSLRRLSFSLTHIRTFKTPPTPTTVARWCYSCTA